ncbi:keratin, type II cytoskeletal 1-like [Setaria italica]|uniref:keratin, type II cytoskeletal 1-like n=1 Tax=Setaria italica TaxID=4555 RepID=UPI000648B094|nr:keratin, type II cytoskeletal 1-like [Setaria italica]
MTQGDSSIAEYCSRMKTLANALRDIGHPIQDSQLVLNLLHSLNPCFSNTASFSSFAQVRDILALKELRLANEEKISNSTALLTGNSSSSSSSSSCTGGCHPPSSSAPTGVGGGTSGGTRGGSNGGRNGGGNDKKKWQQKKGGNGF